MAEDGQQEDGRIIGPLRQYPVDEETRVVFRRAMLAMNTAGMRYAVGGAFALHWYIGSWRVAKDLDFFMLPDQVPQAMRVLRAVGFNARMKHSEWLAEALMAGRKVDLIFGMGNWLQAVDSVYIDNAKRGVVLGVPTLIVPPEEMIYSKSFVASRDRYDGADIFHMLVATGGRLDWQHLLGRFGSEHWEVLLSHLVMFSYIFPSHRDVVPGWVLDDLLARFQATRGQAWQGGKLCRGFLVDGIGSYSLDVEEWGYRDAREEHWHSREDKSKWEEEAAA